MLESWNMKKLVAIVVLGLLWSTSSFAYDVKDVINKTLWRLGQDKYVLFLDNKCYVHLAQTRDTFGNNSNPTQYDREYNTVTERFRKNNWLSKCSFKNQKKFIKLDLELLYPGGSTWTAKGFENLPEKWINKNYYIIFTEGKAFGSYSDKGLTGFERMRNKKHPPNIRGSKVSLSQSFKAKLQSASTSEPSKIVKTPKEEIKKPIKKKPIVKKPEKKIKEKIITKAPEIDKSLITIGSGSGFYINNKGYALTNNHVIEICMQSIAVVDGRETLFRVIATDKTNDVAVLKTDLRSNNFIKINENGAKLGENVIAVGYPLAGRLSDSVKITRGIVSSLSGLDNNIGQIQIDAALQPGNSGGPVLNDKGNLVGIASAGLNKLLMAKEAKYIPENVNFAVASPIVVNILKSKKVKYSTPSMFSGSYSNTELAELGDSSTIQLFCRNTRTAYNRLKKSNKYSTVLLDLD